jgi:glycosyltransferase involved in cell wall biosynthesis
MRKLRDSLMPTVLHASPAPRTAAPAPRLKVLFFVEGFTDIRFVVGLSEICELTLAVPSRTYQASGLAQRIAESGAAVTVATIAGGRLGFQARSLGFLLRHGGKFDVILAQEMLRGALNANLAGILRRVPVIAFMALAPAEYFRCRRERGQISRLTWLLGDTVIRTLMCVNGRLATRCVALGPYLVELAQRYCSRVEIGRYYGVDTDRFRPATHAERTHLRQRWQLPKGRFLVFFSSRISHEKDAETVLRATALARAQGLDAVVLNLGGGYRDFLQLARTLHLSDVDGWVIGGPALHPIHEVADVFRAADVVALASLAEGLGLSTLEALACGTPVVATAVGGMAVQLQGWARLTPRRDAEAMAREIMWVAGHREQARAQALAAREHLIVPQWNRAKTFAELEQVFADVARRI